MAKEEEFKEFKDNVDYHIRKIKEELNELKTDRKISEENEGNIQHNYELIYELKEEIRELQIERTASKILLNMILKKLSELSKEERCLTSH